MNQESTSVEKNKFSISQFVGLHTTAAMLFYFADILVRSNMAHWLGWSSEEWIATTPGLLLYGTYFLAGGFVVGGIARLALSKTRIGGATNTMSAILLSCLLMLALYDAAHPMIRETLSEFYWGIPLVLLAMGLPRKHGPWIALCVLVGIVGGLALLQVRAITMASFIEGSTSSMRHALLWTLAIGLIGSIVGILRGTGVGRRGAIATLLLVVAMVMPAGLYFSALSSASDAQPDRKNVLLITADTLRADYTSVYGGSVATPALQALADEGTLFEQYHTLAPWTVPSFAGMFSSQYPPGVTLNRTFDERMEELSMYQEMVEYWEGASGQSLIEGISQDNYSTATFIGNFALFKQEWLLNDFDNAMVMGYLMNDTHGPVQNLPLLSTYIRGWKPELYEERPFDYTRSVREHAQGFLKFRTDENFFLWAHFFDPHTPYDPPERFREVDGPYDFFPIGASPEQLAERKYIQSLYEAEIRYIDESVGAILETLDSQGLKEDTFVIFSSDHGEEFWDHGRFGHGHSLYEEQLHVPFIVAGPDIKTQVVNEHVSGLDFMPTLAGLLGLEGKAEWRGIDHSDVLKGTQDMAEVVPIFAQATGILPQPPEPQQMVIDGNFKLIRGMETGKVELYNIKSNYRETKDSSEERNRQVKRLTKLLDEWAVTFPTTITEYKETIHDLESDQEMTDALESLGYLE